MTIDIVKYTEDLKDSNKSLKEKKIKLFKLRNKTKRI